MDKEQFEKTQELMMVALTSVEYNQDPDREQAEANLTLLRNVYPEADINRGAMEMLSIIMLMDAQVRDISVAERATQLRGFLQASVHATDPRADATEA